MSNTENAVTPAQQDKIDLRGIMGRYLKNWYWFVLSVILCCGAGYVYIKKNPPLKEVRANVLITDNTSSTAGLGELGKLFSSDASVQDEVFVIKSHTVLRQVARDLQLNKMHTVRTGFLTSRLSYPRYPVDVQAPEAIADTLSSLLEFDVDLRADGIADIEVQADGKDLTSRKNTRLPATLETAYGTFTVVTDSSYVPGQAVRTTISYTGYDAAAEMLDKDVQVDIASKKSNIIELSLTGSNPTLSKAILNNILEVYNREGYLETKEQSERTARFLDERLDLIAADLNSAERRIQDYKDDQGIMSVESEATYNTGVRGAADAQLVTLRTNLEILEMTRDFLKNPANHDQLLPLSADGLGEPIKTYNSLLMQRMQLLNSVREGNQQLAELDATIKVTRDNLLTTVERALANARVQIKDVENRLNSATSSLDKVPAQEREFINLKRQQQIKQQLYLYLAQRREENAMITANILPKARIIDNAFTLGTPVGTNKKVVLLLTFVLGLAIPAVLIWLKRRMRTKFDTRDEVQSLVEVPVVGEVCTDRSGNTLVVQRGENSSVNELFRLLRTNLRFVLSNPGDKVINVTSTRPGEGKSFIASNLAASLSLLDKRVVLVGLDIRSPQLANYLGIDAAPGVTNYLSDSSMDIEGIIQHEPLMPDMDIITAGPVPPNPGELLSTARLDQLFAALREKYDYIVVDTAPVGMVSDTITLDRLADATLYVVRANHTRLNDLTFINNIKRQERLKRLSIVVNGTRSKSGYGYGYGKNNNK